jgi:hypothetical protein
MMGDPMNAVQILTLLLALSGALNTAFATGLAARLAGASPGQAILTAAGAAGTVMAIFLAAVSAYSWNHIIREVGEPPAARMLVDGRDRLEKLAVGDLEVRAAFAVSYRQLADGDARLFRLLGLHPGSDFSVGAAASLAGIEEEEAAGAMLGRREEASMVTEDGRGRFSMHDLLHLFARGTCQEVDDQAARDAAEARLVAHCADLPGFLDSCLDPPDRATACWRDAAAAMRDAGDQEEAARLEQLVANARPRRRLWRRSS